MPCASCLVPCVVRAAGVSHTFVYYSDDVADLIGVTCGMFHTCEYNTAKIAQLSAEDAICDGQPHGAAVTVDEGFLGEPMLEYFTEGGDPLAGPPSEPGDYTAKMSCAGKTVSRSFSLVAPPRGSSLNPWVGGDSVTVWTNGTTLVIEGMGAMSNFANAASVPWAGIANEVTAVTIAAGVTKVGANAFAGFAEKVPVSGLTATVLNNSVSASEPIIPDNMVLVTKESIEAAKAETAQIVNGQIELGVSVCSNADITASTANWAPVKFTKDTQIGLSADGTKLVLPIPVAAQQGFMILQSGGAKAVPSDGGTSGFYMIKVVQ